MPLPVPAPNLPIPWPGQVCGLASPRSLCILSNIKVGLFLSCVLDQVHFREEVASSCHSWSFPPGVEPAGVLALCVSVFKVKDVGGREE